MKTSILGWIVAALVGLLWWASTWTVDEKPVVAPPVAEKGPWTEYAPKPNVFDQFDPPQPQAVDWSEYTVVQEPPATDSAVQGPATDAAGPWAEYAPQPHVQSDRFAQANAEAQAKRDRDRQTQDIVDAVDAAAARRERLDH
ncbi:MAG: hypothetical protein WC829_11450 [Hyphomicrobium sp.]